MKIEAGKYYKTRDGRKIGPMKPPLHEEVGYGFWGFCESEGKNRVYQEDGTHGSDYVQREDRCDLIAEWPDPPKLWRDMTAAEKGALLLAHHEGKVIERSHNQGTTWKEKTNGLWHENHAYRVKPETTVETVAIYTGNPRGDWGPVNDYDDTHRITFNMIDGKPDPSSIRMEEL